MDDELDATEAMAASLICHLVSGTATQAELDEALTWRDACPDHGRAFARLCHVWTLIGACAASPSSPSRGDSARATS